MYWEDRVSMAQLDKISSSIEKFQNLPKKKRDRSAEHDLYDSLTNNGMTSEEADEYINALLESI